VTLVVVSSSLTTYPLINTNNKLLFLKNTNIKKIEFNLKYNSYINNIFELKNFYNSNIKLLYYYYYFEKTFIYNSNFNKNNYYISLNKKKNHYYISIIKNNTLHSYISVGTMLKFFNFEKKYLRRSKKGFNIFINTFKKFFNKISYENVNLSINFLDFNFLLIKKNLFRGIFLNNFFLFKLNLPFNTFKYKKFKSIKRRLKKKFLKRYVL
jgi:hypothetical protein